MPSKNDKSTLQVADFTKSVKPLLDLFEDKFPANVPASGHEKYRRSSLVISDITDINGSQYVDLVQEGGGVHGIALAGYTYVLEKMGVAFTKMAGTSAGSINTILLSAVTTKSELKLLQQTQPAGTTIKRWELTERYDFSNLDVDKYYDTRSEKLVEYLSAKSLEDLVDGHSFWRQLILNSFNSKGKYNNIKSYFKKLKRWSIITISALLLTLLLGLVLVFAGNSTVAWIIRAAYLLVITCFIAGIVFFMKQVLLGKYFARHSEQFGINPGDDFETWIQTILEENNIRNVAQLKNKLQLEETTFLPAYQPSAMSSIVHGEADNKTGNQSFAASFTKIREKILLLDGMITAADQQGDKNDDAITELLDEALMQLMNLSKKIAPEDGDKYEKAQELLLLYTQLNVFQLKVNDTASERNTTMKKEIAVVSSDITNEMKAEFPAMHKMYWGANYDISPAKYVRASMSIPGFFKPFKIEYDKSQRVIMEQEWKNLLNIDLRLQEKDTHALLMDGGMISNFPVNIFYNQNTPVPFKPTVGVKLEFEDDATSNTIDTNGQVLGAMLSTMRYFYDRDFMSKHNIFKKTVRSIDTGKIHWLNFNLSDQEKIELFFRGALTAIIFLMGNVEMEERAKGIQQLLQMGKQVDCGDKKFSIYSKHDATSFLTEDDGLDNVSFNWSRYKLERILVLGEQNIMKNRIKRKAGFSNKRNEDGVKY